MSRKIGERVRLKREVNPSFKQRSMVIIDKYKDEYLCATQVNFGGIWMKGKDLE